MATNSISGVGGFGSMQEVLNSMKTTALQAGGGIGNLNVNNSGADSDFSNILKNSINKVNETQISAEMMAKNLAAGDTSQNLHEVMMAMQTASISFQQMVQVRNKMVSAYQEVMNMQV